MLPLRDDNPTRRTAWVTFGLIALNVVVFLLWEPTFESQGRQQTFFFCEAEIPYEVTHQTNLAQGGREARAAIQSEFPGQPGIGAGLQQFLQSKCPDKSWLASIFVAMFLHEGWLHIGGNMLFLWIFGNNVEDRIGHVGYLLFYVTGGAAAAALQLIFAPSSVIPNLGASGAIAAVLGAYLVTFPRARVLTLVIFFFVTVVELPAVIVLGAWFVLQLFSGVGGLGSNVNAGVAYWVHVGGFAFGMVAAYLFLSKGRRPRREPLPPRPDL